MPAVLSLMLSLLARALPAMKVEFRQLQHDRRLVTGKVVRVYHAMRAYAISAYAISGAGPAAKRHASPRQARAVHVSSYPSLFLAAAVRLHRGGRITAVNILVGP